MDKKCCQATVMNVTKNFIRIHQLKKTKDLVIN